MEMEDEDMNTLRESVCVYFGFVVHEISYDFAFREFKRVFCYI
jgi:hypothetical protein